MADAISAGTEASSLDAVTKLLGLFLGSGKQTTTTSGGMSTEGLSAILKQSLDSNQGLAQLLGGEKAAGLYNSSTNQLLSNDLLTRLTAQAQANSISKTVTQQTQSPLANVGAKTAATGAGGVLLNKLLTSGTKLATDSKARSSVTDPLKKVYDWATGAGDIASAGVGALGAEAGNLVGAAGAGTTGIDALVTQAGSSDLVSSLMGSLVGNDSTALLDSLTPVLNNFGQEAATAVSEAAPVVDTLGDTAANFPSATSGTGSAQSGIPSGANTVVADATTAGTSVYNSVITSPAVGSLDLGSGLAEAGGSTNILTGTTDVGYDLGSGLSDAGGSANVALGADAASSGAATTDIFGGSGSSLGYLGSAMYAMNAQDNPNGEMEKDYRQAVGSAVLNYFGFGWATPIVDAVAKPVLNEAMSAGNESLGNFGTVLADPIGAPLSGEYDVGHLVTSTLDPANILGGNEGGSVGHLSAAIADPVGAAMGGEGLNGALADLGDSLGKVICTELALQGKMSESVYHLATSPALIMRGQLLRGYHVIGVPFVRLLRTSDWWSVRIAPWVVAYVEHKSGKKNWRGRVVKSILHPLSWFLGFFNRDPEYFKVLYRRNRSK